MPRARNIKPAFFANELLGTYDPIISLFFIGLWCLADKNGILEDRPLRIKAELFPYRNGTEADQDVNRYATVSERDVNRYLTVLERDGFVVRYEVDGLRLIQVVNFHKHQHPHKTEQPKGYPPPTQEQQAFARKRVLTPLTNGELTCVNRLNPDLLIPDSFTAANRSDTVETLQTDAPATASPPPTRKETPDSSVPESPGTQAKPKQSVRGKRLPADWTIPAELVEWAISEHGYTDAAVRAMADRFRDYWHAKAGADAAKVDWPATWRNWVRTDAARSPPAARPINGDSPHGPQRGDTRMRSGQVETYTPGLGWAI